jgi:beta-glucosidase
MNKYVLSLLCLFCGLLFTACQEENKESSNPKTANNKTENQAIEAKIDSILQTLSLEEKVGQTCQVTLDVILKKNDKNEALSPAEVDPEKLKVAFGEYHVGSILNVGSHTLTLEEWDGIMASVFEPYEKGETKVPIIYGIDAIHGVNYTVNGTLFPQEIGLAASWDTAMAKEFGDIVAYECRASGIHWNFSPVLDLGRSPLWSRHFETLGEDPFLAAELGKAIIDGYQGPLKDGKVDAYHTAACMKHFVGYSGTNTGRDRTPAWIPEKYMKELYFPPFQAAVEQGALTVMINSGIVNGIPGHTNYKLLTKTLKEAWGFQGFAVSDWEDYIMLHTVHEVAENHYEAIIQAFNAGVDMSMVPNAPQYQEYCQLMIKAVNDGRISQERLDDAVRRILRVKLLVGLFDKDQNQAADYADFNAEAHKAKALEAALASITLLKNENDILPLKEDQKVLVAGPVADDLMFLNGAWSHTWQGSEPKYNTKGCKTIKEAFQAKIGEQNCLYAQGAELFIEGGWGGYEKSKFVELNSYKAKLRQADVVVLCIGEFPSTEKPGDIRSLNISPEQIELAHMAYEMNKKVVLVLVESRPRIIRPIVDQASAIVQTYLPGDYGADALVKLLYGEVNFSGKLPYTYPKYDGIFEFYDHERSVARAKSNAFDGYDPEWDFGFGLKYGTIRYSNLKLSSEQISHNSNTLTVSVEVKNESEMASEEIVQLYVKDQYASMSPPNRKLKRFSRIKLAPNEQKTVDFEITLEDLKFVNADNEWIAEKGKFNVMIDTLSKSFDYK